MLARASSLPLSQWQMLGIFNTLLHTDTTSAVTPDVIKPHVTNKLLTFHYSLQIQQL